MTNQNFFLADLNTCMKFVIAYIAFYNKISPIDYLRCRTETWKTYNGRDFLL